MQIIAKLCLRVTKVHEQDAVEDEPDLLGHEQIWAELPLVAEPAILHAEAEERVGGLLIKDIAVGARYLVF